MGSKNDAFTLEENLALTNDELTSNWSKLASLIRSYENCTWNSAQIKAREFLKEKSAIEYIEAVRKSVNEPSEPKVEKQTEIVKTAKTIPAVQKNLYEKNYERLLKIAPDFEERFLVAEKKDIEILGRSKKTGFMDLILELLYVKNGLFYISLSHYYKQNGDMIADPDMEIRVDIEHRMIEALAYQDAIQYSVVYEHNGDKVLINPKEKKDQNSFLTQWLRNLINSGHKIVWDDVKKEKKEQKQVQSESEFIDEYSTKSEDSENSKPKTENNDGKTVEKEKEVEQPTKEEPMKEEPKKVEPKIMQFEKLVSLLMDVETGYNQEKAETKAKKLIESETATDYLIIAYEKLQSIRMNELLKTNFTQLMFVVPNLVKRFKDSKNELSIKIKASKEGSFKTYNIIKAVDFQKGVLQFAVYEKTVNNTSKGTLLFALNPATNQIWVTICSEDFHGFSDYSFDSKDEDLTEVRYQANRLLAKWIYFLITKGYKEESEEIVTEQKTTEVKTEIQTESNKEPVTTEKTADQQREELLNHYKENAKKIPDFELGQVQYTEEHKKAGVKKKDINWINKHKQGLVLIPKEKMNYNTKNESFDKALHAEKPGMRLSRYGKIYYEGRSNRADLSSNGL